VCGHESGQQHATPDSVFNDHPKNVSLAVFQGLVSKTGPRPVKLPTDMTRVTV
jgi:hypothetical protein